MKKSIKIIVYISAILVLLVVTIAFSISPLAKYYIEKNSKQLIGRQVRMANLKANIFTGSLEVDSLRLFEVDDKELFVTLDTFKMNLEILELLSQNVVLNDIRLIAPSAVIWQKGDQFNFSDLMKNDTVESDTVSSSFPKLIVLKNIYIAQGKFVYTDQLLNHTMRFNELGVNIPELQFGSGNTNAGIHLKIGDQAELKSRMEMNMQTNDYNLFVKLSNLPVNIIKPYLKGYYEINDLDGSLNADVKISGNTNHLMSFLVSGNALLQNLNVTNKLDEPVISGGKLSVDMKKIDLTNSQFIFNSIQIKDAGLNYIMHPTTDNISALYPTSATTSTTASPSNENPIVFKVGNLAMENSSVIFKDKTLRKPYELVINQVKLYSENFDLNGINQLKGEASLTSNGKLNLFWKGNINDLSNQEIGVKLINFDLKNVSPYCYHYTAYDLTSGNLRFETKNKIVNNNLKSSNTIDVYKVNVSKKNKDFKPEFNLPLRTAMYILKDKDDKINFVVPVSGNINDPEFKYWKIVFKTLGNLLVKVATSPFKFMGNVLGLNAGEDMSTLQVMARNKEFTADEYSKIDDLLNVISQKPAFNISFTQFLNFESELDQYELFKAKEDYLVRNDTALTYEEIISFSEKDTTFIRFIDSLSVGKTSAESSFNDKLKILYPKDTLLYDLQQRMNSRNRILSKHIATKIDSKKFRITNASPDSIKAYKGKAQYKIELNVEGDE